MNKYELAVVVSAKLEDEARAEVIEKVKTMITRFGGNVTDVDEWGKRRFAYEIQKMKEGFYYVVQFDAPTSAPAEIITVPGAITLSSPYFCVMDRESLPVGILMPSAQAKSEAA